MIPTVFIPATPWLSWCPNGIQNEPPTNGEFAWDDHAFAHRFCRGTRAGGKHPGPSLQPSAELEPRFYSSQFPWQTLVGNGGPQIMIGPGSKAMDNLQRTVSGDEPKKKMLPTAFSLGQIGTTSPCLRFRKNLDRTKAGCRE